MNAETKVKAAKPDANMRIWDAVSKTDPRHTKKVNQRGGFTAISAHYQVMSATAEFGPVGIGWGYVNGEPIWHESLVIVPVTIWHGERGNLFGPVYGGAEWRNSKGFIDSDAPKKAATDGLTKALSHLGFNADVFLGKFEDNKYVEQVTKEFADGDTGGKVEGIHKIKQTLNTLMLNGDAATDLEAFNALVHDCKAELTKIRDAKHQYWTGDGEDFEGFAAWIKRRREELANPESTGFQFLMSLIDECDTIAAMQNVVAKHGDAIDALDGAEARRFQARFDEREAGLGAVAKVSEGA